MRSTMQLRGILGLATLAAVSFGEGRLASATTYIFATFKGDDAAGMKLSIYTSTDSLNFTLLSDTGFGGNTSYIRDPSIMKYTDGKYYIAYTDPTTASCCNPEDHFGIAVSSDLIHWTDLATVKAGVPSVSRVWAPEWYVEGGVVRIIANIDTGNELPDFQPYFFTAQDSTLTTWSGPTALGIGADYIDTYVAKLGTTYHAFIKSETTRYLEHATAPSLTGPWTFVGKNDWAGWGSGMEGPAIVQLDNGTYRMYVDPQAGGVPCQTMTSSDLNTWSAKSSIPGTAGTVIRHGTVIRDEAGLGSNGYFTPVGGAGGTGGATATGGAGGAGGAGGTAGAGGNSGTAGAGGVSPKGGTTASGGTNARGGSSGAGGTSGFADAGSAGGTPVAGGTSGLGGRDSADANAPGAGGRGGSAGGSSSQPSGSGGAGNVDAAAAGSAASGGTSGERGGTTTPDTRSGTGGALATGGTGSIGGSGGTSVATGGSIGSTGGTTEPSVSPDAQTNSDATASGCSCAIDRGSSSRPTSALAWLLFGLIVSRLNNLRRKRQ